MKEVKWKIDGYFRTRGDIVELLRKWRTREADLETQVLDLRLQWANCESRLKTVEQAWRERALLAERELAQRESGILKRLDERLSGITPAISRADQLKYERLDGVLAKVIDEVQAIRAEFFV